MKIYNIFPAPDSSWKATLVGDPQVVLLNDNLQNLIDSMSSWAEQSAEAMTIRIHNAQGDMVEEVVFTETDSGDA